MCHRAQRAVSVALPYGPVFAAGDVGRGPFEPLKGCDMNLDDELIKRFIEPNPHNPGADEARIARYGVPVWAVIGYLQAVGGDEECVARDYELPIEAVGAAIAYYRHHQKIIDARIDSNLPVPA